MLDRTVVPARLALLYRDDHTLGYNPALNVWERLEGDTAEVLRWMRAGRDRSALAAHLARRFEYTKEEAETRLRQILNWCIIRRLLYLDEDIGDPQLSMENNGSLSTVYWICTQACNLRCTYCYQDATYARPNELTTAEAKDLVDQALEAGADTFIFTGGEPFMRRDLLEVARYSRSLGLVTNVVTNGHFITTKTVSAVSETFDNVNISLDHGKPEHHDRARGEGSWAQALNAIQLLLDADVHVDVNSVLSRLGLDDVEELVRLGNSLPIGEHRIVPQFPMGRGSAVTQDELSPSELIGLGDKLLRIEKELNTADVAKIRTDGDITSKGVIRNHCGAGLSEVSVDSEGWVYPCKLLQYPEFRTENVRAKRLAEIYEEHPVLGGLRRRVAKTLHPCKTCIIKNHCAGGCRGIHYSMTTDYGQADLRFCAFLRSSFEAQAWKSTGFLPPPRSTDFENTPIVPLVQLTRIAEQ
jgi:radical SAM protein with 4Fe4S-binding SPASM domain